jgi:hypothetical protein
MCCRRPRGGLRHPSSASDLALDAPRRRRERDDRGRCCPKPATRPRSRRGALHRLRPSPHIRPLQRPIQASAVTAINRRAGAGVRPPAHRTPLPPDGRSRPARGSPLSRLMKNLLRGEGDPEGPDAQTYEAGRRGAAVFAEYGEPRRRRRWLPLLRVASSAARIGVLHQPVRPPDAPEPGVWQRTRQPPARLLRRSPSRPRRWSSVVSRRSSTTEPQP